MPYKIRPHEKGKARQRTDPSSLWLAFQKQVIRRKGPLVKFGMALLVTTVALATLLFVKRRSDEKAWNLEAEAWQLLHEENPLTDSSSTSTKALSNEDRRTPQLLKATAIYHDLLEKRPNSPAAFLAHYQGGNAYFDLGKYDEARETYLALLKKWPHRQELSHLVHLKLAYLYQAQGNTEQALAHFRAVYEGKGYPNQDQGGFELGRLLETVGKKSEAEAIYRKVSERFTESPWGAEAKARLVLLAPEKLDPFVPPPALVPSVPEKLAPAPPSVSPTPTPTSSLP